MEDGGGETPELSCLRPSGRLSPFLGKCRAAVALLGSKFCVGSMWCSIQRGSNFLPEAAHDTGGMIDDWCRACTAVLCAVLGIMFVGRWSVGSLIVRRRMYGTR